MGLVSSTFIFFFMLTTKIFRVFSMERQVMEAKSLLAFAINSASLADCKILSSREGGDFSETHFRKAFASRMHKSQPLRSDWIVPCRSPLSIKTHLESLYFWERSALPIAVDQTWPWRQSWFPIDRYWLFWWETRSKYRRNALTVIFRNPLKVALCLTQRQVNTFCVDTDAGSRDSCRS